jgi:hypothetical protein
LHHLVLRQALKEAFVAKLSQSSGLASDARVLAGIDSPSPLEGARRIENPRHPFRYGRRRRTEAKEEAHNFVGERERERERIYIYLKTKRLFFSWMIKENATFLKVWHCSLSLSLSVSVFSLSLYAYLVFLYISVCVSVCLCLSQVFVVVVVGRTAESVCYICDEVMKLFFYLDCFVLELISSYSWSCDFFAPVILARFFFF